MSHDNDVTMVLALNRFQNTWKHMNQRKKQCWTLFVIPKATFKKTVIKTKFIDRFFKYIFSTLIDQCIIVLHPTILCWLKTFKVV